MLVLSRKKDQVLRIGDEVILKVIEVRGGVVRLGIDAPDHVSILRGELAIKIDEDCPASSSEAGSVRSRIAISACPR